MQGQNGSAQLAILGFDTSGNLTQLKSPSISTSIAPPSVSAGQQPTFRVTAGNLTQDGVAQLVIGYCASKGGVDGVAALILVSYDDKTKAFSQRSQCVGCNENQDPIPFAETCLHLGAGIFGSTGGTLGVLVMGMATNFEGLQKAESQITAGLVSVDPQGSFGPGKLIGEKRIALASDESIFFGAGIDFSGLSVVLGVPTLLPGADSGNGQILAVLTTPPYQNFGNESLKKVAEEANLTYQQPMLTFSDNSVTGAGQHAVANHTWTMSNHVSARLGVGPLQLHARLSSVYGNNFHKAISSNASYDSALTIAVSTEDMLIQYTMQYLVWSYPIYQASSGNAPAGTVAVIFPQSAAAVPASLSASNTPTIGYRQPFEPGCLLSYVNAENYGYQDKENVSPGSQEEQWLDKDGHRQDLANKIASAKNTIVNAEKSDRWQEIKSKLGPTQNIKNRLSATDGGGREYFETDVVSVTGNVNTDIHFGVIVHDSKVASVSHSVHNSTSDSVNFAVRAGKMFKYLPVNFGLNISKRKSDAMREANTTTLRTSTSTQITVSSGSVSDPAFQYSFQPIVYSHLTLGCMVVEYIVSIDTNEGWQKAFPDPYPMLIKPFRSTTSDSMLASYSRSITLVPANKDQTEVDIQVEIFNCGFAAAKDICCAAFSGQPTFSDGKVALTSDDVPENGLNTDTPMSQIGTTIQNIQLAPLGREIVSIPWSGVSAGDTVTVQVWGGVRPRKQSEIAWNIYPEQAYATISVA